MNSTDEPLSRDQSLEKDSRFLSDQQEKQYQRSMKTMFDRCQLQGKMVDQLQLQLLQVIEDPNRNIEDTLITIKSIAYCLNMLLEG